MSNIFKYQGGGDISSLFVNYVPFQGLEKERPASSKSSSSEKESKKDEVGLKDFLNLTKELKGLPVDMAVVGSKIKTLLSDNLLFNNGELSTSNIVSMYLSTLLDIRRAEYNEKAFTDAKKQVTDAGGLNEVALDREGNIFVQDLESGKIIPISIEEYNSVKEETTEDGKLKYQPLTNNNLLYYREHDPNFAFKNGILNVINNGIGMDEVTKLLQLVANHIGENTLKYEGLSERTKDGVIKGFAVLNGLLKEFASGMSLDGIYKQGVLTKDQMDLAKLALNYLWNTLPNNAKSLLKFKGGSNEGAFNLIQTLVFSGLDYSREYTQDKLKDSDKKDGSGNGSGDGSEDDAKGKDMDPATGFILGMGRQNEEILNPGTSYQIHVLGRHAIITDHSGKALGQYSTLLDVSNSTFAGILDLNNMTFGGVRIESYNRAFLENADIVGVDLPIDLEYFTKTGIIRPDIGLMKKMEDLHAAIKTGEIDENNMQQVNAKCDELGLPHLYLKLSSDGIPMLNQFRYARFAKINALVDERALLDEDEMDGNMVREVDSKRRKAFKEYMKTADKNYDLDEDFLFFGGGDDLYEGNIYIPVIQDIIAASYGGKYYKLPKENAITVAQKFSDAQTVQSYNASPRLSQVK